MKKLLFLLTIILISCSVWGANIPAGTKLYLTPNSNWKTDNARFAAYFFGDGDEWVSMTKVDGETDLYEVTSPSGKNFTNVIFCRMNPSASANNWDNKWNQTADLIYDGTNNHYTVKEGTWDKGGGTWALGPGFKKNTPIYFKPNSNWTTDNAWFAAYLFGNGEKWIKFEKITTDGTYLCDFNTDNSYPNIIFVRMKSGSTSLEWENKWNQTADLPYDKNKNLFTVDNNSWDNATTTWSTYTPTKLKITGAFEISDITVSQNSAKTSSSGTYKPGNKTITISDGTDYWKFNNDFTLERVTQQIDVTIDTHKKTATIENTYVNYENLYISGLTSSEIKLTNTKEHTFSATDINVSKEKKDITIKDKTTGWSMTGTANIIEEASRLTINVNINTEEISISNLVSPNFTNTTNFEVGEYGQLNYQLTMKEDRWYWISLPFDVNVADITVDGATNGVKNSDALVITEYNAEARAAGSQGWTNINSNSLKANKGYVMGPTDGAYNANMVVNFPSTATTNDVNSSAKDTLTSTGGDAQNANWYIIGTGLYHQGSLSNINYVAMPAKNDKGEDTYEYKYISSGNELFTEKLGTNSFAPFTAFFVQYGGDYSATAETTKSAALAPVARAKAQEQEQIYLINMNEAHTVVILNAEGSEGYTAGEDFLEMNASNHSDLIYSFDGSDALAFNHRALEAQSINLGGYVATAGEQTISLNGYNANVESVTLIDNFTGETADLLAGDYTFTAEVGSLDGRFTVVFGTQKAGNTTVDCYNSTANQLIAYGSANACTVSGLTTGEAVVVYNAMGQLVFATIADSETITLPTLPTGNYLILHNGTTNKTLLK